MVHYEALQQCCQDRGHKLRLEADAGRLALRSCGREHRRLRLGALTAAFELLLRRRGWTRQLRTPA